MRIRQETAHAGYNPKAMQSDNGGGQLNAKAMIGAVTLHASKLSRKPYVIAIVVLFAHIALSATFAFSLPMWESYDEPAHYEYARFIALNERLPEVGDAWPDNQEFHQPPLYYWLMSWIVKPIDLRDGVQYEFVWTPIFAGKPDPRLNAFPWVGTALATRVMRLATVLLSAVAVFGTFLASLALFPRDYKIALLAMSVHAFWPMYVFMSGTISNDNMIAWCGSFVSLFSYGLLSNSERPAIQKALCYFGLVFSWFLAVLSKDSAVALTVVVALVFVAHVSRLNQKSAVQKALRLLAYAVPCLMFGALALFLSEGRSGRQFDAGVRFVYNGATQTLGPGSIGVSQMSPLSAGTASLLLESTRNMLRSSFGVFARSSFGLPDAWYEIAGVVGVFIVAGVAAASLRKKRRFPIIVASLSLAIVVALPMARAVWARQPGLANGRFALSGITALSILVAVGVTAFPRKLSGMLAFLTVPGLCLASLLAPVAVIRPLYARPLLYAGDADKYQAPNATSIRYGDEIELIGFTVVQPRSARGSLIQVFPYWKPLKPITTSYALRIEVFGSDGESFGVLQEQIPGKGSFPTTEWKLGDIYSEGFWTRVYGRVDVPAIAKLRLSWVAADTGDLLTATCRERACQPLVGQIPVELDLPTALGLSRLPSQADFGAVASLLSVAAIPNVDDQRTTSVSVTLTWRALANSPPNTIAFVHIVDELGRLIAQRDDPPRHPKYPMWAWRETEIIPEVRVIDLPAGTPAGEYRILVGMYDPRTQERLPIATHQSERVKDGVFAAGSFWIP